MSERRHLTIVNYSSRRKHCEICTVTNLVKFQSWKIEKSFILIFCFFCFLVRNICKLKRHEFETRMDHAKVYDVFFCVLCTNKDISTNCLAMVGPLAQSAERGQANNAKVMSSGLK